MVQLLNCRKPYLYFMKKFLFTAVALFGLTAVSLGQIKKVSDKAVIKTPGLQAESCKDRIEFFIGKMDGITSVKGDFKKKTVTVTWLTDRATLEDIKTAIANLGFDADDIEAEEYAYKRLPKECKRPDTVGVKKPILVKP